MLIADDNFCIRPLWRNFDLGPNELVTHSSGSGGGRSPPAAVPQAADVGRQRQRPQ